MTPDRRSPGLPSFSEPAADAPVPAGAGGRCLPPLGQGADFRQPPGEEIPVPSPVRRAVGSGGALLAFSDPDRQI